jgi:peptidoglycan hydrolase-like protein with peptidoglycan-binding domain
MHSGDLHAARRSSVTGKLAINASWFSPGEIDGKFGENATKALRAYAEAQQLPSSDAPTEDAWKALRTDDRPVTINYTIAEQDVAGPILPKLPSKMEDMKDISKLSFTSSREGLAEKFHMSEALALSPARPAAAAPRATLSSSPGSFESLLNELNRGAIV